jgi:hypothetical protein
MNLSKTSVVLAVAWWALPCLAAPVPVPGSTTGGPITDALRLRDMLPRTAPLTITPAVLAKDGVIMMERRVMVTVPFAREVTVQVAVAKQVIEKVTQPDGKVVERVRTVTEYVPEKRTVTQMASQTRAETISLMANGCKFYVVTKDGKLEAIDAEKATAMLKKKIAVLTGDSANVDPRTLEMVKPGTLCVIPPKPVPTPRSELPDDRIPN